MLNSGLLAKCWPLTVRCQFRPCHPPMRLMCSDARGHSFRPAAAPMQAPAALRLLLLLLLLDSRRSAFAGDFIDSALTGVLMQASIAALFLAEAWRRAPRKTSSGTAVCDARRPAPLSRVCSVRRTLARRHLCESTCFTSGWLLRMPAAKRASRAGRLSSKDDMMVSLQCSRAYALQ